MAEFKVNFINDQGIAHVRSSRNSEEAWSKPVNDELDQKALYEWIGPL